MTPNDNRALAHVLKSPIFGAIDDDLLAEFKLYKAHGGKIAVHGGTTFVGDQERTLQDQTQYVNLCSSALEVCCSNGCKRRTNCQCMMYSIKFCIKVDVLARYAQKSER